MNATTKMADYKVLKMINSSYTRSNQLITHFIEITKFNYLTFNMGINVDRMVWQTTGVYEKYAL